MVQYWRHEADMRCYSLCSHLVPARSQPNATDPKSKDNRPRRHQQREKKADHDSQAPNKPAPIETQRQPATATANQNGGGIQPQNEEQPIRIVSPIPPVTVRGSVSELVGLIATVVLAVVGIIGIVVALRTLRVIGRQTDALVNSERAWIIAELVPTARKFESIGWQRSVGSTGWAVMSEEEIRNGEHLRHRLRFINMGRTAADISRYEVHCGLFDWKNSSLRIEFIHYNGDFNRTLAGSDAIEMPDEIIDVDEFVKNPAAEVYTFKHWMVVLVSVTYRHVFSDREIENEVFRFVFNPKTFRMERRQASDADKKQARELNGSASNWKQFGY